MTKMPTMRAKPISEVFMMSGYPEDGEPSPSSSGGQSGSLKGRGDSQNGVSSSSSMAGSTPHRSMIVR